MADFPNPNVLGNPTVSTGSYQTAIEDFLKAAKQIPGGPEPEQALTIGTGTITPASGASGHLVVDTEGAAGADDLDHIAVTNLPEGNSVILRQADNARNVTVRHGQGGSGQILLAGAANFTLGDTTVHLWLQRRGTNWIEVARSFGADKVGARADLGLGTAAVLNTGTGAGNLPTAGDIHGKQTFEVRGDAMEPRSNSGAAGVTKIAAATVGRPDILGMKFLNNVTSYVQFQVAMPKGWNEASALTAILYWASETASTGTVRFKLRIVGLDDGNAIDTAFGTEVLVTDVGTGVAKQEQQAAESGAITPGNGPFNAHARLIVELERNGLDAGDTFEGDVLVTMALFRYDVNALNDN